MINFFRKTRKILADDNKPLKYARYAIGEIVLVVIGILIALSINNWNEQQKLNIEETIFLQRIKNDLVKDVIYYDTQIKEGDTVIVNAQKFLQKIYSKQNTLEDFRSVLLHFIPRGAELVVYNSAFQELKNSGKLNIIKNIELRETIVNHYRTCEHITLQIHDYNVFTRNLLASFMLSSNIGKYGSYIPPETEKHKRDYMFNKSEWGFINKPTSLEFRKFESVVTQFVYKHVGAKGHLEDLKQRTSLVIKNIDNEQK